MSASLAHEPGPAELPMLTIARAFWHGGANVFPIAQGTKRPAFSWRALRNNRLLLHDARSGAGVLDIIERAGGRCNLALITGRISGNLAVLDCDDMPTFAHIRAQLEARHIPIRGAYTARGAHLYLRIDDELSSGKGTGMEVHAGGGAHLVIAPGSVHHTGAHYRFIEGTLTGSGAAASVNIPTVPLHELTGLTTPDGALVPLTLRRRRLSQDTLAFMNSVTPAGGRNDALFEAALDMSRNGYALADCTAALAPAALRNGTPGDEADRTIVSAYTYQRPAAVKLTDAEIIAQAARACADAGIAPRRINTRARVLACLWQVAQFEGNTPKALTASVRLISERTGISKLATITAALSDLVNVGLTARAMAAARPGYALNWRPTHTASTLHKGTQRDYVSDMSHVLCTFVQIETFTLADLVNGGMGNGRARYTLKRGLARGYFERVKRGVYRVHMELLKADVSASQETRKARKAALKHQYTQERARYLGVQCEKALFYSQRRADAKRADAEQAAGAPGSAPAHAIEATKPDIQAGLLIARALELGAVVKGKPTWYPVTQ